MKKLTVWLILFYWGLYVLVPIAYKFNYGNYPENLQSLGYVPELYMTKAAIIISVVFFVSILLICSIPGGNRPIADTTDCNISYYYIAIAIYALLAILIGATDFNNVLAGGVNGTLFAYYSMLFYPVVLFLISLFCIKDKGSILILVGCYLMLTLLSRSRAGAVHLIVYLIGYALVSGILSMKKISRQVSSVYWKYRKRIKQMVIILIMIAPFVFVYSTNSRGSQVSSNEHGVIETIAARCSCLDEAGLALYICEEQGYPRDMFLEKYGIVNQIECIIDSTIPGSVFGGDVNPNQYFRAIVGYMSVSNAVRYYSSTNLMLPVYMVIKYGIFAGISFSIMMITLFYIVISRMKKPVWKVTLIYIVFTEMIYFFDWVMVWNAFLRTALTVIIFEMITQYMHIRHRKVRLSLN